MSPAEGPTVVFKGQVTTVAAGAGSVASGPGAFGGVAAFLCTGEGWGGSGKWEEKEEEEESSSIGVVGEGSLSSLSSPADEDQEEDGEEVQSRWNKGALASLGSLEEALPVK